ncbi:hypothetical protein H5410_044896 [Solanum commersonii]|uniref:MADS-box domain-containing protein n=1 Tax=Solanum commersonii TaxID=4109 RepID=A0A9J5XB11_SOLCO|nr:hypothetical protein H5410_044896 [Solanum commersonii]
MDKTKGRQKIEMKLIESKEAHTVTFSKRKKGLFKKADEYSTLTRADVEDRQGDHADVGKSNVFEAFEDLRKEGQALEEKVIERPRLAILSDKHMLEQYMVFKSRLDKVKKERKGKYVPEPEEEESS